MKNLENKSKKKRNIFRNLFLILAFLFIFIFIGAPILIDFLTGPAKCRCCQAEADAQNTLAAIASYFAVPDNNRLPTFEDLVEHEDLVINENSTVIIEGSLDDIKVTVIDNKSKCPLGNKFVVHMDGVPGTWYSE
jgi:hypothetical protein